MNYRAYTLRLSRYHAALVWLLLAVPGRAVDTTVYHENVLGTSLELQVRCDRVETAEQAERAALAEIDRLQAVFSGYDNNSELSRLIRLPAGGKMQISHELFEVLRLSEGWTFASGGAFNPAVEELTNVWNAASRAGRLPTRDALTASAHAISRPHWRLDGATRTVTRTSNARLSLNAIAKGAILDRVAESLMEITGISGVMINIGGDIRVVGELSTQVSIASPQADAIGAPALQDMRVSRAAVATSGRSERQFKVGDRVFSHIIDPRDGWPAQEIISATVLAEDGATADALATVCSVLPAEESLQLVNRLPHVECLLVTAAGAVLTSVYWPGQDEEVGESSGPVAPVAKNDIDATTHQGTQSATAVDSAVTDRQREATGKTGHNFTIEFEISKPANAGGRYRRPYVAVWVEDEKGFPVKTLSLFLMKNDPGPRWYRDLRRWYSDDQMRLLYDDRDFTRTVSKPTRNPGKYKVTWDGLDDADKPLKPGKYTLLLESAREHGTYQLLRHEFEFGGQPFTEKLKGNQEIGSASIRYSKSN